MGYDELSIKDKAAIIKTAVLNGITNLKDIQELWDLLDRVNSTSTADFVDRLKNENREVIQNEDGSVSTHKLSYATGDQGVIVYPEIQRLDGKLVDLSGDRKKALLSAIQNRDTVLMTPELAEWFTTHYKDYYSGFKKYDDGGSIDNLYLIETILKNRNSLDRKYDFIVDTWESEYNSAPKGYNKETDLYYPYNSAEGGEKTIGPGLKVRLNDKGDKYSFTREEVKNGVTKELINLKLGNNAELLYDKVLLYLNLKGNRLPYDTISPTIMRGLMDLRYLSGTLGKFNNLRDAVLNGDLNKIKKESRVFYRNRLGKATSDERRNQHRIDLFWYYPLYLLEEELKAEGGKLFTTGGPLYPFSFSKQLLPSVRY